MIDLRALRIGDFGCPEFREASQELAATAETLAVPDLPSALEALASSDLPVHLAVLAQHWPGQFPSGGLRRLQELAPLARVVTLLGSCCEGEVRTGEPWPAAGRVAWHQWTTWYRAELERLAGGDCPVWGLPLTAGDDERLLAVSSQQTAGPRRAGGSIVIHSPRAEMADWLTSACRARGYATVIWESPVPERPVSERPVSERPVSEGPVSEGRTCDDSRPASALWEVGFADGRLQGAGAALWDDGGFFPDAIGRLRRFRCAIPHAPLLALFSFPRIDDRQQALQAGAAAVLAKPLRLDDLYGELERLMSPAPHVTGSPSA